MNLPGPLVERLTEELGGPPASVTAVGGGDVNHALRWVAPNGERFFVKWNAALDSEVFLREAQGLEALGACRSALALPPIRAVGGDRQPGFLVLDWFETVSPSSRGWQVLGQGLAQLHRCTADSFGFTADNFIGRLPQSNDWDSSWTSFWVEQRIEPLLRDTVDRGLVDDRLQARLKALCADASRFCDRADVMPGLLHGDLWSGNVSWVSPERPVVYDPAVYYGDREVELAFTELFGGFDASFYTAYDKAYPLAPGYRARRPFWQLYPLLVHLSMFGGSYRSAVESAVAAAEMYAA